MTILIFIVQLMSAATLLLYAVRFLRIGVERLWSGGIRASLNERSSVVSHLAKGAGLGFAMQGATAVLLMAAGLAGSGTIPVTSAVVLGLGADLGSALAVVFLHLPVSELGPLAILIGGSFYLRSSHPGTRNYGRVGLGLGLIFLSLSLMRAAIEPLNDVSAVVGVVRYFEQDPLSAALFGCVLTLLMHSGLAAILAGVAYASTGDVGPVAGVSFVLGCNLGSALLPLWLLRGETASSVLVARTVAVVRMGLGVPAVILLIPAGRQMAQWLTAETGLIMLATHIGFNAALFGFAPLSGRLADLIERMGPRRAVAGDVSIPAGISEDASLAASVMKRQLNAMLELLASMFEHAVGQNRDPAAISDLEARLNRALSVTRQVYAKLPDADAETGDDIRAAIEFAIRLERCGDILSGKYLRLRIAELKGEFTFSDAGKEEIAELAEQVRQSFLLAQETIWTGRADVARRLVEHKHKVASLETHSRDLHLRRVRHGNLTSLASSDQHLEVIAALKEVNSKLCTIGYAVLDKHGGLTESRLKTGTGGAEGA